MQAINPNATNAYWRQFEHLNWVKVNCWLCSYHRQGFVYDSYGVMITPKPCTICLYWQMIDVDQFIYNKDLLYHLIDLNK